MTLRQEIEDLGHGVRTVCDEDEDLALEVDGEIVWSDGGHEPEDIQLGRDLRVFVATVARLASERDELAAQLAALRSRSLAFFDAVANMAEAELRAGQIHTRADEMRGTKPTGTEKEMSEPKDVKPGSVVSVWATMVNSDANEGRGVDVAIAYFWNHPDALEFGRGKSTMGSNGSAAQVQGVVDRELRIWINGSPRSIYDSLASAIVESQKEKIRTKLLRGGLTLEDHLLLNTPAWARG